MRTVLSNDRKAESAALISIVVASELIKTQQTCSSAEGCRPQSEDKKKMKPLFTVLSLSTVARGAMQRLSQGYMLMRPSLACYVLLCC